MYQLEWHERIQVNSTSNIETTAHLVLYSQPASPRCDSIDNLELAIQMPPPSLHHRRTHNLLLISKLLHQRDAVSPFTLILDTLEQSGKPLLAEYMKRATVREQPTRGKPPTFAIKRRLTRSTRSRECASSSSPSRR
jgi:hypothetical protein